MPAHLCKVFNYTVLTDIHLNTGSARYRKRQLLFKMSWRSFLQGTHNIGSHKNDSCCHIKASIHRYVLQTQVSTEHLYTLYHISTKQPIDPSIYCLQLYHLIIDQLVDDK
jgi:hypothetical protein